MGLVATFYSLLYTTVTYYFWFAYFYISRAPASTSTAALLQRLFPCSQRQLLHVYSLAHTLHIWDKPHYRAPSLRHDMAANLCNLGIPGTGVPLSWACASTPLALLTLLVVNPLASLGAALYQAYWLGTPFAATYSQLLLEPNHWFATWRLNSLLVAHHALVTNGREYQIEDKGTFLLEGDRLGLPVSPFCKEPAFFIKHKSIEGGMGIHVYRNFATGGDWIIQPALQNSAFLAKLLPEGAPLSTVRVVTASWRWLEQQQQQQQPEALLQLPRSYPAPQEAPPKRQQLGASRQQHSTNGVAGIEALGASWRAGLAGADTDHACVCFPVQLASGVLGEGVSSQHWYHLGLQGVGQVLPSARNSWSQHPESGTQITGKAIPDWGQVLKLTAEAHAAMCPLVPLVGWDVALTPQGPFLLELNLSCQFFNGVFDVAVYTQFMCDFFEQLHAWEDSPSSRQLPAGRSRQGSRRKTQ